MSLKRAAAITVLSVALGAGVAGCATPTSSPSPSIDVTATAAPSDDAANAKAAGAQKMMDALSLQVKEELPIYRSKATENMSKEEMYTLVEESFPKTLSHVKDGALTPESRFNFVVSLAQPYTLAWDNVDVESDPADYKINGDTATFSGMVFKYWLDGKEKVQQEGGHPVNANEPSTYTLTLENGNWLITGYDSGR